ncbi:MAG: hypothetical protein WDM96_00535 [Lacunisphaera sp.]
MRAEGHEPRRRLGQILYSRGINGLIIASHGREMGDVLDFAWGNFSAVKIDYFPHRPALHNVTNNQCDIVRLAMQRLLAAGYRRLGLVMHRGWDHAVDHLWTAGYLCEQQVLGDRDRIPAHLFPEPEPVERWPERERRRRLAGAEGLPGVVQEVQARGRDREGLVRAAAFPQDGHRGARGRRLRGRLPRRHHGRIAGVKQNHNDGRCAGGRDSRRPAAAQQIWRAGDSHDDLRRGHLARRRLLSMPAKGPAAGDRRVAQARPHAGGAGENAPSQSRGRRVRKFFPLL